LRSDNLPLQRGIKLILCLEDFWLSVDRYIKWSQTAGGKNDFYTDYAVRQMYKAHLRYFVSRVNSISGVMYRDDPTIMAWCVHRVRRSASCGALTRGCSQEPAERAALHRLRLGDAGVGDGDVAVHEGHRPVPHGHHRRGGAPSDRARGTLAPGLASDPLRY